MSAPAWRRRRQLRIAPRHRGVSARCLLAVAAVLAGFASPLGAAHAATPPVAGIRVFDGHSETLARFTSAKCRVDHTGFVATAYDNRYLLYIRVHHFTGFHRYGLRRGVYTGTFIEVRSPSLQYFASDFIPPYPAPGGGEINFADHGKRLGGGFYPMFNESGSDGIGVAGSLNCRYPKPKTRR